MRGNTVAWQSAGILLEHSGNTDDPVLLNELLSAPLPLIQIWPEKMAGKSRVSVLEFESNPLWIPLIFFLCLL